MLTLLLEQPLPILIGGMLVTAALAGGFVNTGRTWLLSAAGAAAVATLVLLAIEYFVVTEREQVEGELYAAAADLERNDLDAFLARISPQATAMRTDVSRILPQVEIRSVSIKSNLEIGVRADHDPPLATARFNLVMTAKLRNHREMPDYFARFFIVSFRKEGDRWRMTAYEMHEPLKGGR